MLAALAAPGITSAAAATPSCTREMIEVPILSTDGAVIVPVEINGMAVAAEVSPRADPSFVFDAGSLDLPWGEEARVKSLVGVQAGHQSYLKAFRIGSASIRGMDVVVFDGRRRPAIAGRRVVMTIGADILDAYDVLMDLPGRTLTLFRDRGARCPDPGEVLGDGATTLPMREGERGQIDVVGVAIDGHVLDMEVNVSSNDTIIHRAAAFRLGVSDAALGGDPEVRTGDTGGFRLGRRHQFASLAIGGFVERRPMIDVQPRIAYDLLGLDMLRDKVVLFDFPGRRMMFRPVAGAAAASRLSLFGSVRTKNADTAVEERPPAPAGVDPMRRPGNAPWADGG